jgi:hypothetical protein
MRAFSFILAFGFVLAGCSLAGTEDSGLPNIGTFAYSGPAIWTTASTPVVVASRL